MSHDDVRNNNMNLVEQKFELVEQNLEIRSEDDNRAPFQDTLLPHIPLSDIFYSTPWF